MSIDVRFGHSIFGYTTIVQEGNTFVALTGEGEPELRVGMEVVLLGDSRGYVPSGFSPGDEVTIVGFTEPFKNGESDHIVKVSNKSTQGRVKPSNIQRSISAPTASTPSDKRHQKMRKRVHPAAADLMDAVYLAMSEQERLSLSDDIGSYANDLVAHALRGSGELQRVLAQTIARLYVESPDGERFVRDPLRSNSLSEALLFLDSDCELVSVKNPEIVWDTSNPPAQVLKRYESYEVLTGRLAGKRFSWPAKALGEPRYKGDRVSRLGPIRNRVKIFLCHSSGDKAEVRELHSRLRGDGLEPWLDEIDIRPGMEWRPEIENAVRRADVVLVCLSKSSITKTGFVQKEISFALDAADERPEGRTYIVPARLDDCEVPKRLSRWQWVDLFKSDGYEKLVMALTIPDPSQAESR
jgi:hypothetical protein